MSAAIVQDTRAACDSEPDPIPPGKAHPVAMKRRMASATVASGSAQNRPRTRFNPRCPSLFLIRNLLRGSGLLLLLGGRGGFDLLLCCLLMYGLRRLVAHISLYLSLTVYYPAVRNRLPDSGDSNRRLRGV